MKLPVHRRTSLMLTRYRKSFSARLREEMTLQPAEPRSQLRCRNRPSRDDGRERVIEERGKGGGAVGAKIPNIGKGSASERLDEIDDRFARQRMLSCIRLIQNHTQAPEIEGRLRLLAGQRFRREVQRCTHQLLRHRE